MDCLKPNFYKDRTMKDGSRSSSKFCTNQYHYSNSEKNLRERKRREKDFVFKLANNIRCRTSTAFTSQVKKKLKLLIYSDVLIHFFKDGLFINFIEK